MGGGGRTSRTSSHSQQRSTSNVSTPGTAFGTGVLQDIEGEDLSGQILGQEAYSGPFVAAPHSETAIGGALDVNQANQGMIAPAAENLGDYWNTIAAGGGADPRWAALQSSLTDQFQTQAAFNAGQRALYAGAEGAFGGTPSNQANAFATEAESRAFNQAMAELGIAQLQNEQGLIQMAPGQLQDVAGLTSGLADREIGLTDLQQENVQAGYDEQQAQYQSQVENLNRQLAQLAEVLGFSRAVPGATTTSSGTASGSSRTRESEDTDWLSIASTIVQAAAMAYGMSDRRIKHHILPIETDSRGVQWYDFHYIWEKLSDPFRRGVIAQELREIAPQFVHESNGLLVVDYAGLNEWKG